jgi:hypothetical protein
MRKPDEGNPRQGYAGIASDDCRGNGSRWVSLGRTTIGDGE